MEVEYIYQIIVWSLQKIYVHFLRPFKKNNHKSKPIKRIAKKRALSWLSSSVPKLHETGYF